MHTVFERNQKSSGFFHWKVIEGWKLNFAFEEHKYVFISRCEIKNHRKKEFSKCYWDDVVKITVITWQRMKIFLLFRSEIDASFFFMIVQKSFHVFRFYWRFKSRSFFLHHPAVLIKSILLVTQVFFLLSGEISEKAPTQIKHEYWTDLLQNPSSWNEFDILVVLWSLNQEWRLAKHCYRLPDSKHHGMNTYYEYIWLNPKGRMETWYRVFIPPSVIPGGPTPAAW